MHGKFGFPRGKPAAIVWRYPVFFLCAVFSCFRNPPNSDMDFNVHTWSFLCVRSHTGVGRTDNESAQHFDSEKLTNFSCAPDGVRTSGPLDLESRVDVLPVEPARHPSERRLRGRDIIWLSVSRNCVDYTSENLRKERLIGCFFNMPVVNQDA